MVAGDILQYLVSVVKDQNHTAPLLRRAVTMNTHTAVSCDSIPHTHTHTPHCCRLIHICCPKEYLQQFLSPVWVTTKLQSPAVQEEATWQLVKVYQLLSGADLLVKWPTLAYKVCEVYPAAQKVRSYWSGQETGQSLGNSLLWELTTADTRVTHSPRCDMRRESRWLRRKRLNDEEELMEPRPRAKGNTTAQLKIFTSGSFRPWSFILCRVFF